jgi:hypothetical protein
VEHAGGMLTAGPGMRFRASANRMTPLRTGLVMSTLHLQVMVEATLPGKSSSTRRFLHQRGDPRLVGRGQLLQREGDRPQGAFVEVRLVAEAFFAPGPRCASAAPGRVPSSQLVPRP